MGALTVMDWIAIAQAVVAMEPKVAAAIATLVPELQVIFDKVGKAFSTHTAAGLAQADAIQKTAEGLWMDRASESAG